jgi:hypothetical protein
MRSAFRGPLPKIVQDRASRFFEIPDDGQVISAVQEIRKEGPLGSREDGNSENGRKAARVQGLCDDDSVSSKMFGFVEGPVGNPQELFGHLGIGWKCRHSR